MNFLFYLCLITFERNGKPIGIKIASDWLYVYPKGICDLLLYTKEKYNNPSIYITENGINEYEDSTLSVKESLIDTFRIDYHYRHLFYLQYAITSVILYIPKKNFYFSLYILTVF
ncbi:unnamed protein product [Trifolium pratense]|uniref:Uncharacterized protein n=1 Tax=Trifolium pratense TaxID=57577 RepID=A0ACB0MAU1_TRIPR|nr:unnamed protein product [Trifolium pratense]